MKTKLHTVTASVSNSIQLVDILGLYDCVNNTYKHHEQMAWFILN